MIPLLLLFCCCPPPQAVCRLWRRAAFAAFSGAELCPLRGGVAASAASKGFPVGKTLGMGGLCPAILVKYGDPAKAAAFVGSVSRPGATHFCHQTKVGKSWLRTCGSKDPLFPRWTASF